MHTNWPSDAVQSRNSLTGSCTDEVKGDGAEGCPRPTQAQYYPDDGGKTNPNLMLESQ
jgi:hypothetical protein